MWPFKRTSKPGPSGPPSAASPPTVPAPSAATSLPEATQPHPRYGDNPMNLLFESLILDVIGHLPPDRAAGLERMRFHEILKTRATGWRAATRESLHLSDTIDTAILDLWIRNSAASEREGAIYLPLHFAQDFVDHYYEDDSKVDVWPEGTLQAAKARIEAFRRARLADA